MNTFEQLIKAQQSDVDTHKWPQYTIGHLIRAIMGIHNPETAKSFRNDYIENLKSVPDLDRRGPVYVADANIGWCFGEGMSESDRSMWRTLGASHPIFGAMKSDPTAHEAFGKAEIEEAYS